MPETHHTQSLSNYPGQNILLKARPTTLTLKSARSLSNPAPQKRLVRSPGLYVYDPSGSLVKFGQVTDRFIHADAVQEAPSD